MPLARIFWPALAAIAAAAGVLEVRSALGETQTWDEGVHISAGYSYLTRGDYSWNIEHPPLAKLLSALPLTRLGLVSEPYGPDGKRKDEVGYGIDFLYHNRRDADTILFDARLPSIALTLLFIAAVGWWTRRRWGWAAGLLAASLCAFDPNFIAHGRYVATDFPVAVFFFFACVLWAEYLEHGGFRQLLAAAAAIALALVVKFSAILLIPLLVLVYAACWIRRPAEFSLRRAATAFGVVFASLLLVVALVYWPETLRCFTTKVAPLATVVNRGNFTGKSLYFLGRKLHLPAHAYLKGLGSVAEHNAVGHESYLLGMHSQTGWWYYFPVVFAVKSTVTTLAATLLLFGTALWAAAKHGLRWVTPMTLGLTVPPLLYFVFSMTSSINIGIRHILPIYPFLYVGVAAVLAAWHKPGAPPRLAMLAFAALQIAECVSIHPDYLAFFNALSGGPGHGPEYLVDSNIDWGQDVKKLFQWLQSHGTHRAHILYFGNAQLGYYGIDQNEWPDPLDQKGWDEIDDWCVASVTPLKGVYVPLNFLARLRLREPVAKIGWSMYVYDFRKHKR